ncbi:Na+/H+ antiporter subunit E [Canibacter zhoujuaniae]|uniref:Na+/H+ antiporter subunit E n=1 Tax=Canibacter zhoujuaniae TaxID=2708343 RepID=UPI00141E3280|nr:Na+/H+ antiporter subunit E [Canibacter zhoujuaniae]
MTTELTEKRAQRLRDSAESYTDRRFHFLIRVHELPLIFGLVVVWMMLWQEVTPMSFVSGIAVAILVTRVFYLPPVELAGRFNIFAALQYFIYFLWELVLGSLQVAWHAVNPFKRVSPAVVEVRLRTRSDFILTMTGLTISLIPGSLIVDVDRFNSVLYLHMLHGPEEKQRDKLRRDVHKIERLLVNAIGSRSDMEDCRANS